MKYFQEINIVIAFYKPFYHIKFPYKQFIPGIYVTLHKCKYHTYAV